MFSTLKQNILFLLFVFLSINILLLTGAGAYFAAVHLQKPDAPNYDIIQCADAKGRIHNCIRVDPSVGEVTNASTGANYRVIYGQ
jgi:hypothetical protein